MSRLLIPSSTNRRVDHFHPTGHLSHLSAGIFLLHAAKKNNKAANFFLSLTQNNSEGFMGAPLILALKTDDI